VTPAPGDEKVSVLATKDPDTKDPDISIDPMDPEAPEVPPLPSFPET